MQAMKRRRKKKTIKFKWIIAGIAALVITFSVLVAVGIFHVDKVEVTGNSYYTEAEIEKLVMGETRNSLYLVFLYDYLDGKEIPFVDSVEVSMVSPSHVKIRVYEKTMIGYVEYMGANLYFDKDGTVVESSTAVLEGVPCIKGLKFDTLTLYQPLNVANAEVFEVLLSMTQMMKKYELAPDAITLKNDSTEVVLTFKNVRINLGAGDNMDEKASRIKTLLPDLEDKSGTLHMEEYTNESTNISFIRDK
jgi:cell division protein FtsQ